MTDQQQELRGRVARSERARAIIEDPLLVEAFDILEQRFTLAWRFSPADATDLRERLWHHLQALAEVKAELESVLQDGMLARHQLSELAEPNTDQP